MLLSGIYGCQTGENRLLGLSSRGTVTRKCSQPVLTSMHGRARAPAAGTVLNALANGSGSAFAIDAHTTAEVTLDADANGVVGHVADAPDADTRLIERCVDLVVDRFGSGEGGHVYTESEIPMAAGLKSSSAAANAVVLATLDALEVPISDPPGHEDTAETGETVSPLGRERAARIGVEAARDVGVTVTGAFDDASASMLGGVTITNNRNDTLLHREPVEWDVLVWSPPERAYSADADVTRCTQIAPVADFIFETALSGKYAEAMTVNGFAFSAALGFSAEPLLEALPAAEGVSLSGTGPSVTAIGDADTLATIEDDWDQREGTLWHTTTHNDGARTI